MKTRQSIVRILMALTIVCGTATTASAQFGGLLNKAKKAVTKEQPKKEQPKKAEQPAQAAPTQTEKPKKKGFFRRLFGKRK